jgi:hypothetical protein
VARHVASGGQSPRRPLRWWLLRPPLRQGGVSFKCFLFWLGYLRSAAASFTSVLPSLRCCPCELGRAGRHSSCDSSLVSTVGVSFSSGASCAGPTGWCEVRGDDPNRMSPRPAAPSSGHVAGLVASGGLSPLKPLLWWLLRPPLLRCGVSFKCFLFWLGYLRFAAASFASVAH